MDYPELDTATGSMSETDPLVSASLDAMIRNIENYSISDSSSVEFILKDAGLGGREQGSRRSSSCTHDLDDRLMHVESDLEYLLSAEDRKLAAEELDGLRQTRRLEDQKARGDDDGTDETYGMDSDDDSMDWLGESDDLVHVGIGPSLDAAGGTKRKQWPGVESSPKRTKWAV